MSISFANGSKVAVGALNDLGNAPVIGGLEAGAEKLTTSADAVRAAGGNADVLDQAASTVAAQKGRLGEVAKDIGALMEQPAQLAEIKKGMGGLVSGGVQDVARAAPAPNAETFIAPKSVSGGKSV